MCFQPFFLVRVSVIGLPAAILLGGVAGGLALGFSGLIVASKKLDSKIKKSDDQQYCVR